MDIQKVKKIKVDWLGKCPKCERTEHTASTVEGNKSYLYDGDIVECWCGQTGVIDVDGIGSAWCEWNEKPRTIIDDFNDYYREKFPNYWNVLHKNNHQACTHYFDLLNAWQVAKADAVPPKRIHLNCCQLMQATNFGAPSLTKWPSELTDEVKFLLETEMVIEYQKNGHRGEGFYCWYEDLPEEGSIFLEQMIEAQEQGHD